ncbi:MAG TPA: (2Fe-2S)-binding protein [Methylophilaceae bacterium]
MYVCVCMAVTERQIHQAARDGAKTLKDLRDDLGVSSQCGQCAGCAKQCLKEAQQQQSSHHSIASGMLVPACA